MATGALSLNGGMERHESRDTSVDLAAAKSHFMKLWLSIPLDEQPPSHYRLLGVRPFETDPDVIGEATDRLSAHVRTKQIGKNVAVASVLLNEISAASGVLLNAARKAAYDADLRTRLNAADTHRDIAVVIEPPVAPPLPQARPLARAKPLIEETPAPLVTSRNAPQTLREKFQANVKSLAAGFAVTIGAIGTAAGAYAIANRAEKADATLDAKVTRPADVNDSPTISPVATRTHDKIAETMVTPVETPVVMPVKPAPVPSTIKDTENMVAQAPAPRKAQPPRTGLSDLVATPSKPAAAPVRKDFTDLLVAKGTTAPDVKRVTIDAAKLTSSRASIIDAVRDKTGEEKFTTIREFLGSQDIMREPESAKAVLEELMKCGLTLDVRRAHEALGRIKAMPALFEKSEIVAHMTNVKNMAGKAGDRMVTFGLLDELQQEEAIAPEDVLSQKAYMLRKESEDKDLKKPVNRGQRVALADDFLHLARTGSIVSAEAADALLVDAKKTFALTTDKAFNAKVAEVKGVIDEAKRFNNADATLKDNPTNSEALKVRGDIYLSRGKTNEALTDFAGSSHALNTIAKETLDARAAGTGIGGKQALTLAEDWMKAANQTQNGRKKAMLSVAAEFATKALSATNDKLNAIEMTRTRKLLEETGVAASSIAVTQVGEGVSNPGPVEAQKGKWTDISPSKDVDNYVRSGSWKNMENTLVSGRQGAAKLKLPIQLQSADYDFDFQTDIVRLDGTDTICLQLPIGDSGISLVMDGWSDIGGYSYLSNINGVEGRGNPKAVRGVLFPRQKKVNVHVKAQRMKDVVSVLVSIDGKPAMAWSGRAAELAAHSMWKFDEPESSFGICTNESSVQFGNFKIKANSGKVMIDE